MGASVYFIHPDHLGSLNFATDSTPGGTLVWTNFYYPYGLDWVKSGSLGSYKHKFTGQERDTESGLYYYKSRFYDQQIGRFTSPDPLQKAVHDPPTFPRLVTFNFGAKEPPLLSQSRGNTLAAIIGGSVNPYTYVRNNPINFTDILGLVPGDRFLTWYEAAWDALSYYNPISKARNVEYSGVIYYNRDSNYYSYVRGIPGTEKSCRFDHPGFCRVGKHNHKKAIILAPWGDGAKTSCAYDF
jgi:RHS repeat-associated protein